MPQKPLHQRPEFVPLGAHPLDRGTPHAGILFGRDHSGRRAELMATETSLTSANDRAIRRVLETAGVEFIDENGGGPGVRLRKPTP